MKKGEMKVSVSSALIVLSVLGLCFGDVFAAEAIEVTKERVGELPGGKEADGIIGDFVLRSDKVEAVISHNAPLRRANMSTFYGDGGVTPGCLYDLTLRGKDNDQITILAPLEQRGEVSYVRIVPEREVAANEAAVETVVTAALGKGVFKRYRYIVTDGVQGVTVLTTLRNEGKAPVSFKMQDKWTGLGRANYAKGFLWGDAVDPADKAGYALSWVMSHGVDRMPKGTEVLKPGEELTVSRFLAVGASPLDAVGIAGLRRGGVITAGVFLHDDKGNPATTAALLVEVEPGKTLVGYPDDSGAVALALPAGTYSWSAEDQGRETITGTIKLEEGVEPVRQEVKMGPQSVVIFSIKDDKGKLLPCKVQFSGREGTKNPNLGPQNRAHGCRDQWHSERGDFRVPLAAGKYRVTVTRGIEYSHYVKEIDLAQGEKVAVKGTLRRLVDTKGWVSTDYHNHSTPSGDNTCGTKDRLINLAAEHIEFAPTTEHNRLYDWTPHIAELGLSDELATVPGMELTGPGGHLNMFPLKPIPRTQDGGAPVWENDARINALHLRDFQGLEPDRWVHLNHPRMEIEFFDRNGDGTLDGGYVLLGEMLDGLETENFVTQFRDGDGILAGVPYRVRKQGERSAGSIAMVREVIWLQLLNQGTRVWAIAVADAHSVWGNGVGGWRTYVPSSTDNPSKVDWRELSRKSKEGQMVLTTGPFLNVTANGALPGADIEGREVSLDVTVQCTDWIDIDRVQVLVNGRQRPDLNFTRKSHPEMFRDGVMKFNQSLKVKLEKDSHLIVVAMGENFDLKAGYGTSDQALMQPCAYHNPIFVDVDGNGFIPNGDTLGFPLPTKKMKPERVIELIEEAKK